jgi:Secretion system C-terminal sorting domain
MKFSILFRTIRKSIFLLVTLALVGGYAVHDALSHYTGEDVAGTASSFSGCGGPGCHAPSPDPTTVIHLFTPAKIVAGQTYRLRISVSNPDPNDVAAGFDVDAFSPIGLDTDTIANLHTGSVPPFEDFLPGSITHTMPQLFKANGANSDSAVWSFLYTASPTPGIDTLYLAGNAVNGDSADADTADHWNQSVAYITVQAPSGVASASSASSIQIYPNPASNELFINDGNLSDAGSYTLADAAGRVVMNGRRIPLDGNHSIDVSNINEGAYILSVQPQMGQSFSRKIVIQR